MTNPPRPILVDTDIASDPDDLLALLLIAASPELDLRAITTTYGDTALRAQVARQVCDELGIAPPIAVGPPTPLSGAPIWYAGNERQQLDPPGIDVGAGVGAAGVTAEPERYGDAVGTIIETARACAGALRLVAIGPLTNIALAVQADPALPSRVDELVLMGGDFLDAEAAEHNFRSDGEAARVVFEAGFAIRAIGVDQTRRLRLTRAEVERWFGADADAGPLPRRVERDLTWWHEYNASTDTLVHDPLAVAMITHPGLFRFEHTTCSVDARPASAGRVVPHEHHGAHVVRDFDERAAGRLVLDRIAASLGAPVTDG